jgi:hypothetical protein
MTRTTLPPSPGPSTMPAEAVVHRDGETAVDRRTASVVDRPTRGPLIRFWPVAALMAIFALSVLVRLPSFGIHPMADQGWTAFERFNNTEVWSHNGFVLNLYKTLPVSDHLFAAYVGAGSDEWLYRAGHPELAIYTSFPSTHFVVLFVALKLMGLGLTYAASQVFSLIVHGLCVALVGFLVHQLTRNNLATVIGGAMYALSTGTLWYHMNVWWSHQLLVPVFLVALVVFVRRRGQLRWWQGLLLGGAMTLITWTGAVACVGFALHGAWKYYRTRDTAYLGNLFMVAGMVLAVVLVTTQVVIASGASPLEYLDKVVHRAGSRTAAATSMPFPVMAWRFVNALILDYGGFALIGIVVAARRGLSGFHWEVVLVAAFPLLESFLLLEHDTVYGFGRLKWLIPVILLTCAAGADLSRRGKLVLGLAVAAASVLHVALYFVVFDPIA